MEFFKWTDLPCSLDRTLVTCLLETLKCQYVAKVQKATIPLLLQRKNLVVQACTGSGKTLAYLVPIVQSIIECEEEDTTVHSLVILPSRELAIQVNLIATQIAQCIKTSKGISANPLLLIGGYPIEKDLKKYEEEGARILIGTPGRLYEFIQQSHISLKEVEFLIMDEGDKLLDLADNAKLLKIIDALPTTRTTGIFSATISQNLEKVISMNLSNALQVTVPVFKGDLGDSNTILACAKDSEYETPVQVSALTRQALADHSKKTCEVPQAISNFYAVLEKPTQKLDTIKWFVENNPDVKCIVFFSTCACVEFYYHLFVELFPALKTAAIFDRLHRKMSQKKRDKIYGKFLAAPSGVLLCTDILARGIDIPNIQWIIQYDPPQHSDSFLHRVGRTARAGKEGMTLILLTGEEASYAEFLRIKGIKVMAHPEIPSKLPKENAIGVADIQTILKTDKDLVDKSMKAYVSYIRYYNEHELSYLFQLKNLDVGNVANAFGLFYIPTMRELKGTDCSNFKGNEGKVDINSIPYKDKNKEKQKAIIKEEKKKKREEYEAEKRERELEKKKEKKQHKNNKKGRTRGEKRRTKREGFQKEWDELAQETRLLKRLKKGKITEEEFDKELGYDTL